MRMIIAVVAVVIWVVMMGVNMGFMGGCPFVLVGARGGGAPYINSLHHVTHMGQRGVNILFMGLLLGPTPIV